ncbi:MULTISPECIES: hypothetical protein [unclassified Nocardioides]|jgi:hypothetical protein|uniref:hypothetical protein n=1 Tax=unclassified Nocardioides TaxID=2615069 RepID=UPI0007039AB7|nr:MULTISPECIES: hypothetical protein [unclassified Nocardioides]KRC56980.1 hypothetical protein ASE19_04040 [Nocardioides sp. Root79]KRC77189.1 hypothetical protein ASE20_02905 [Nocardioides sp. Root240]
MTTTVAAAIRTGSGHDHEIGAPALRTALGNELLRLAAAEDALAAEEASRVAYWEPCPGSVAGHRAAARVLRDNAERLFRSAAA